MREEISQMSKINENPELVCKEELSLMGTIKGNHDEMCKEKLSHMGKINGNHDLVCKEEISHMGETIEILIWCARHKFTALLYTLDVPLSVLAVVGMGCTLDSQCTDGMANTVCSSSQCACASRYTGATCTGKTY